MKFNKLIKSKNKKQALIKFSRNNCKKRLIFYKINLNNYKYKMKKI